MSYGDIVVNMIVMVSMFFITLPFILHNSYEKRSIIKLIIIFSIYAFVVYMFASGKIYDTKFGIYIQQFKDIIEIK